MACYHPLPAYRSKTGNVTLGKETADSTPLQLPCGGCIGCRTSRAKEWALRCHLELQNHHSALVATLTYNEQSAPPTLEKAHLSAFLKRARHNLPHDRRKRSEATGSLLRFFASGEYGETRGRPHYHAILFGANERDELTLDRAWGHGHVYYDTVSPEAISYIAGYCSKKIGWRRHAAEHERVDPETGECYTWQPPFILMSRRPGIGAVAKQWPQSWAEYAIDKNGYYQPVPRFLKTAWEAQANREHKEAIEYKKEKMRMEKEIRTKEQMEAAEQIAIKKHEIAGLRRKHA